MTFFYISTRSLFIALVVGLIFGIIGYFLSKVDKFTVAFCTNCGKTVYNSYGKPECPYCKKCSLI